MSRHFEIQCWKSKPQLTFQRPTPPLSPSQAQPCRRRDPSLRRVRRGHDAGTSCGRRRCRLALGDVPSTDDKKLANVLISCRPKGNASSHSVKSNSALVQRCLSCCSFYALVVSPTRRNASHGAPFVQFLRTSLFASRVGSSLTAGPAACTGIETTRERYKRTLFLSFSLPSRGVRRTQRLTAA